MRAAAAVAKLTTTPAAVATAPASTTWKIHAPSSECVHRSLRPTHGQDGRTPRDRFADRAACATHRRGDAVTRRCIASDASGSRCRRSAHSCITERLQKRCPALACEQGHCSGRRRRDDRLILSRSLAGAVLAGSPSTFQSKHESARTSSWLTHRTTGMTPRGAPLDTGFFCR